jgi:hypothetical protein
VIHGNEQMAPRSLGSLTLGSLSAVRVEGGERLVHVVIVIRHLPISGFGFRVSGFGFRVSGFGSRV